METEDLPQITPAVQNKGPNIVSFGGGHGLYAALRAFRLLTESLTAVVTVADDGGSSGRLRDELGGLPPGDLRMALAALCDDGNWGQTWRDVIQHRFDSEGELSGHAVGNLLIAALWQIHGDHVAGLDWMAKLLRAHGRVLPMSSVPLTIEADVKFPGSFQVVRGQSVLASTRGHVENVRLDPAVPPARYETIEAVQEADVLNLGPGSWYTSVMPHLLVPSLAEAIGRSDAVKSLTLNLSSTDGETRNLSLGEHLMSLHRHAPALELHYVLVDEDATTVEPDLEQRALDMFNAKLWVRPLRSRRVGQHDSLKLAACYRDMLIDAGIRDRCGRTVVGISGAGGRTMALTAQVKDELARVTITRTSARKAEVSAIFRFSSALHLVNGSIVLEAELDTAQAAKRLRSEIKDLYGQFADIVVINAAGIRRSNRYLLRVTRDGGALARQTGLVDNRGRPVRGLPSAIVNGSVADAEAAWRGAFLAHGSLTEPGRSSALEVTCPGPEAALALVGAARRLGLSAKAREVHGVDRVVIRDGDDIAALLTRMGSHSAVLVWEERRMRREVRATANRLANFDDANLRRSARAAVAAGARVERALEILGDEVPEHLRYAGQLRVTHKQASLEELGQLADPPMTKDAVAGRIRRLLSTADKHAEELGIPGTEASLTPEMLEDR